MRASTAAPRYVRFTASDRVKLAAFAVLAAAIGSTTVSAQDAPPSAWARANDANGATESGTSPWLGAWSPLRPIVDIPRGLLRAPLAPGVLDAPPPMAGAFVLAGAPGALARDLLPRLTGDTARFGELRVRVSNEKGAFRRPFDFLDSRVAQVSGLGWAPVGSRGVVIGRVVIDREKSNVSSFTPRIAPYSSSPFVATDSVMPPMQRSRARFEGALGLRIAGFGAGLSAGVESREHNSVDFPLRRGGRAASPAIMAGVERLLPFAGLRVGGYYRWSEPTETNVLNPLPLKTVIYAVQGYDEPFGIPVTDQYVFVRNDRRATAVGGTVEFSALGARVVAVYEQGDRAEDQYRTVGTPVRPTDRWRATGSQSRVMAQRELGSRARGTLVASFEELDGNAVRSDLTGIAFDGRDEKAAVEGDVRVAISSFWSAAISGGVTRLSSTRTDYVATINSDVITTTPFLSAEVARRLGRGAVSIGVSAAATSPNGAVPVAARDPNYQRLIAPALAYDAAEASAVAGWLTATMPLRGRSILMGVRSERATPRSVNVARLQPDGERSGWSVMLGVRP